MQAEAVGEGEVGALEVLQPHAMTILMMRPMMMMTWTMITDRKAVAGESLPEGGVQRVREGRGVREVHAGPQRREVGAEVLLGRRIMGMMHRHQRGDGPQQLVGPSYSSISLGIDQHRVAMRAELTLRRNAAVPVRYRRCPAYRAERRCSQGQAVLDLPKAYGRAVRLLCTLLIDCERYLLYRR